MTEEDFNKIIDNLKVDLKILEDMIKEVADDIIREGFSQYPVFIATEHEVKIGELIIDKNDHAATFNIYASTIEEMAEHKLIMENKKAEFLKAYKNPKQFMCVMLIASGVASFIFVPYGKGGQG